MSGVLIVTGGARGIGAAAAKAAARDGWRVVVNFRTEAGAADEVVRAIGAEGGEALAVRADVSEESQVVPLFDAAEAQFGPVTGLVANAGVIGRASTLDAVSLERWERIQRVNATGTFLSLREAVRRMRSAGRGGSLVTLSSMAAALGGAGEFVDYAASKGAVESLTLGLAREVAPLGIRVNAVRPGLIETGMQADTGDPDRARRLAAGVPLGRAGRAEEVAEAIVWLLSERASYVTGAVLPVSGGR